MAKPISSTTTQPNPRLISRLPKTGDIRANLRGLRLHSLPPAFTLPESIEYINLSENPLRRIPPQIFKLKNLKILLLNNCLLESLPSELNKLKKLVRLELMSNKLSSIEDGFGDLPSLTTLYLQKNKLKTLPSSLRLAKELRVITLGENPSLKVPVEILNSSPDALRNYLASIEFGEITNLREAKLIVVGEGNAGKTRLIQSLTLGKSSDSITTEGIEISKLIGDAREGDLSLNIWDFGGQEIYHATHQYFLTKKAIYLLVWVARSDDDLSTFDYWLNVITLLSDGAPILVVQNKCDERQKEIDRLRIRERFPNVLGFFDVSAKTGAGINELRYKIFRQARKLPHIDQALPVAWLHVRHHLENLGVPTVSYYDYLDVCSKFGIDAERAEWLSDYFSVLGVFLHFPDNLVLADTLFLRPEWATNATYRLFDDQQVVDSRGMIDQAIIRKAWSDYPKPKHAVLLELLRRFELCFELEEKGHYVLPARLPASAPVRMPSDRPELIFYFQYDFMPAGIIERAVVRLSSLISGKMFWKGGALLEREGATAIISADRYRRRIEIQLFGENKIELLTLVRNEIYQINRSLNNPPVKQLLPCACTECKKGSPYYFDYGELRRAAQKSKTTIECRKSFEQVPIQTLVSLVDAPITSKEEELFRLLAKIADKFDDENSLATKANEFVRLQPNFFGVGVNLNYLISKVIKSKKAKDGKEKPEKD
jgi:internalin A